MAPEPPRTEFSDDALRVLSWHGHLCYVYRKPMTLAHVRNGRRIHRERAKAHGAPLGVCLVFGPDAIDIKRSNDDLRPDMTALIREADEYVAACCVVVEATGFLAATLRSTGSALALLARPRFAIKWTGTLDEAALWMAQKYPATERAPLAAFYRSARDAP